MDPSIPFTQAQQLGVALPENDIGKIEICLDNSMVVALGADYVLRVDAAVPLALHTMARSLDPSDPLPRKDPVNHKK